VFIGKQPKVEISWVVLFLLVDKRTINCYIRSLMKNNTMTSVERYAKLRNKGFTNKQIAIYWRMTLAQIAGVQSWATRKGLLVA
jgi:predicted PurR-regulated permease PerM